MIVIIDYGAGNLKSVKNALDYLGVASIITDNPRDILKADRVILPGDGSFGYMMENLEKKFLIVPIKNFIKSGKPFLGICLGLQGLFEESEESPKVKGLSIFNGKVIKFREGKVPQIGWNKIKTTKSVKFIGFIFIIIPYLFYIIAQLLSLLDFLDRTKGWPTYYFVVAVKK